MKKSFLTIIASIVVIAAFSSCATMEMGSSRSYTRVNATGQIDPASKKPFHVIRTSQAAPIPAKSTVGIVSAGGPSSFSIFMGAALESKGLMVREMNLYSLLPPDQQYLTDPKNQYSFIDTLVKDTVEIMNKTTVSETGDVIRDFDLDALVNKMYTADDLVTEKQRIGHYLELVTSLKDMISSLNVDYILVGGSPYNGLSYGMKLYEAKTLNLAFSNLIVSDVEEWRRTIPLPEKSENLSYEYAEEDEPKPFWDLSYCEYIGSKLIVE